MYCHTWWYFWILELYEYITTNSWNLCINSVGFCEATEFELAKCFDRLVKLLAKACDCAIVKDNIFRKWSGKYTI